jgi:histidine triad (HIT) family protein
MFRRKITQYASRLLKVIVQMRLMRVLFLWCLENMNELLPVNKICETPSLICFYHPQPAYPVHILLMPKRDIRGLSQLDSMADEFLPDLFMTVHQLVEELELEQVGYRLIVNGGAYQEFPQLHFHLVSGR